MDVNFDSECSILQAVNAPTMYQLQTLKDKAGRKVRVNKQIAHNWEEVAIILHYTSMIQL